MPHEQRWPDERLDAASMFSRRGFRGRTWNYLGLDCEIPSDSTRIDVLIAAPI